MRAARPDRVPEDVGRDRACRSTCRSSPAISYEETRALVGALGQLMRAADPDHVTMEWEVAQAHGEGVRRPQHEPRGREHRRRVVDAARARRDRVHAGHVGRGRGGRDPRERLHDPHDLGPHRDRSATRSGRSSTGRTRTWRRRWRRWASSASAAGDRRRTARRHGAARRASRDAAATRSKDDETIARSKDPKLRTYLKKRTFGDEGTPEPEGGGPSPGGNSFVIQWHDATRLHYDYRLERDGVLVSWAVPKGLPWEPGEKHLAVQTEDHPMEYGTFAGSIPSGHYGAGEVRIWDNGTYDLLEWTDTKVSVRLHGRRHTGEYHLIKTPRPTGWSSWRRPRRSGRRSGRRRSRRCSPRPGTSRSTGPGGGSSRSSTASGRCCTFDRQNVRLVSRTGRDMTALVPGPEGPVPARRGDQRADRRRDRRHRRAGLPVVRAAPAADEPGVAVRDRADRQADPGRAVRVRPAVVRRARRDVASAVGAARAARRGRRRGQAHAPHVRRGGEGHRVRAAGARARTSRAPSPSG